MPRLTKTIREAHNFFRFCLQYREFLRNTLSLVEAQNIVRQRLENRGENFLRVVKDQVFSNPKSPYLPLMQAAHCELGDLEKMVSAEGLEPTLLTLRREGVYVAFEEYKGRRPLVRHGREIPVQPEDFGSTNLIGVLTAETSGSTGAPRQVHVHVDHLAAQAPARMLSFEAHELRDWPLGFWLPVLPIHSGTNILLRSVKYGQVPERYFAHVVRPNRFKDRLEADICNHAVTVLARIHGVPIPAHIPLEPDQALVAAEWMAEALEARGGCVLATQVSKGVRVATAARRAGFDLTGATFLVSGEPVTPGKVAAIKASGAATVPMYGFGEHGELGHGCANPIGDDELHVFEDTLAMIQFPRNVPGHDIVVDAFHWTSLSPTAPNVLLNVESDDFGVVEERVCGCALESYGYRKHVRQIRSFQKLTGEGVTLIGSDAIRALEEVLPNRYGGSPVDYQLAEEEDEQGMTVVSLIIDPGVSIPSESEVIDTFCKATGYRALGPIWNAGNTLRVKRQKPISSESGKLRPLHLSEKRAGIRSTEPRMR